MRKFKVALVVINGTEKKTFEITGNPFLIGSSSSCDIIIGNDEPIIKCILELEGNRLVLTSFDKNYPIVVNSKGYRKASFVRSQVVKISSLEIFINFKFDDQEEIPKLIPSNIPIPVISETKPLVDGFSIVFNEENYKFSKNISYINKNLDFSGHIEVGENNFDDEDIIEIDGLKKDAVQVVYQNNGTVLECRYFSIYNKRKVFISNFYQDKKTFIVNDSELKRSELFYIKEGNVYILSQENYSIFKVDKDENLEEIYLSSIVLKHNERVILGKGTSQIVIKYSSYPKKIPPHSFIELNQQLIKNFLVTTLLIVLPLLLIVLAVKIPEKIQEKSKVVMIYRKDKTEKTEKKEKSSSLSSQKTESKKTDKIQMETKKEKLVEEKIEKILEKKIEKIVEKKIDRIPVKKNNTNQKLKNDKKQKVETKSPKVEQKKYVFNSSSNLNKVLGGTKREFVDSSQKNGSIDTLGIMNSMNSSLGKLDNYNTGGVGTGKSQNLGEGISKDGIGTKGLSGKSSSTSSYVETMTKVLGAIDPSLIAKILKEYIPQFRFCYQREIIDNPSVEGIFYLQFKINSKGLGYDTKTQGKNFSKQGIKCLSRVISLIQFPRPKGGGIVDVSQPLNFYQK